MGDVRCLPEASHNTSVKAESSWYEGFWANGDDLIFKQALLCNHLDDPSWSWNYALSVPDVPFFCGPDSWSQVC